ncbi:MAG: TlyA family RNA methyltransferase [Aestuariivirga sp.]|nr:TlyA family RNA methyltransferase [Aestuariivirga sp.]
MSVRQRLDEALVARGLYPSRSRARDAVLRGTVKVDGERAAKPSQAVGPDNALTVDDKAQAYVSRAALKLSHGLARFGISARGKNALDIGASAGGFTQVLLEQGAAHVTAIDVGHGQMKVAGPRVRLIEGLNARDLCAEHLDRAIQLIVCDVSFISLKLALPPALGLAEEGAQLVALIKPQFEAGRDAVGKGGIVASPGTHERVCLDIADFLRSEGWRVLGLEASPVGGGDGNREFLVAAAKSGTVRTRVRGAAVTEKKTDHGNRQGPA